MVIFLHGEDEFLVGRRKRSLVLAFQKKYITSEVFVFDFEDQGTAPDVKRALDACEGGLFATEKMVVFLRTSVLGDAPQKLMLEFLKEGRSNLPEHTILLFVETGKIKKTHPLTKKLLAVMDKEEVCDTKDGKAIQTMIVKELATAHPGVQFAPEALTLFLTLVTGDTAKLMTELEKLATFTGEGTITVADVELLLTPGAEKTLFEALDALGRGDRKRALLLFRQETEKGEGVYPVLSMCAWQVRRLLLVREAYDRGIRRPSDIVSATKLPPFTVQKAVAIIERFPLSRIKNGLTLLSDIDTAWKQGKADPEVSLDLFVWKF